MSDRPGAEAQPLNWHFPPTFWLANAAELFERAAFYGMFIALAVFLTDRVGFSDIETGYVAACFASILYLLPTFSGAMADKIGFRRALLLAFALLAVGYFLLGFAPIGLHGLPPKLVAVLALAVIMFGGSIIKPVISGTVAKCSDDAHRARAFSIFYGVVNIGAFLGKSMAKPLRTGFTLGGRHFELGLDYINYYAAVMAACGFVLVAIFYRDVDSAGTSKTLDQILAGFAKVLLNFRFMALIVIVAGFWAIQTQLYATMPKYMLRLIGKGASPEWLANINPAMVVIFVVPITHLIRHFKPANAIGIGLFIIPFTALVIALSPALEQATGNSIQITKSLSLHPITLVVIVGIGLQGLAECFLSPKFLEYASKQAPKGEEGLYLGYQHLTACFAYLFGFVLSGHLLDRWCPDPKTLSPEVHEQWLTATTSGGALPEVYAHAHYIWYVYAAIGAAAFVALIIFKLVTSAIDRSSGPTAG